ncbi:MAG: OsmC family protein [Thermodesulfovibrionales bacterium]|nr:OsmC family protein [Thermodesulfovibrionales bacterium]
MNIKITFPGGKKVYAEIDGMVIKTDQPPQYGGEGSAPSPFMYFLASIGTCAGIYILSFCQERNIPTEGIYINQEMLYIPIEENKMKLDKIVLNIILPPDFPQKYVKTLAKVADQCAVKKTIMNPPAFEVKTTVSS